MSRLLGSKANFSESFSKHDSVYPSCSQFKTPYDAICRENYKNSQREYKKQFKKELMFIENMQNKALNGVKLHRKFTHNIISYPMDKFLSRAKLNKDLVTHPILEKNKRKLEKLLQK